MGIVGLIAILIVCGVGLWAVNEYVPMQPGLKKLLNVFVVVIMVLLVLFFLARMLGLDTGVNGPVFR